MSFKRILKIYPDGVCSNDTFETGDIVVKNGNAKFSGLSINAETADLAQEAILSKKINRIGAGEYATATDSALTFTAQEIGTAGNGITCTITADTTAESISVSVSKKAISVTCPATADAITSTPAQVVEAINGNYRAVKLVEVTAGAGSVTAKTYTLAGGSDVPAGVDGELRFDNDRLYIYVSDTWKSIAII